MKTAIIVLSVLTVVGIAQADSGRCGSGKIVSPGDSTGDVITKCGPPEYREEVNLQTRGTVSSSGSVNLNTQAMDAWYYNCGEGRFGIIIYMRGGRVVNVARTSSYGTGPARCE